MRYNCIFVYDLNLKIIKIMKKPLACIFFFFAFLFRIAAQIIDFEETIDAEPEITLKFFLSYLPAVTVAIVISFLAVSMFRNTREVN